MIKTPALDTWRAELAKGERTAAMFDALWRAACAEVTALEFQHVAPILAAGCCRDAARTIRAAAAQQRRGVA